MKKYKKFMAENKKDFLLPLNLSPKEKDIFIYIFQLLRKKIHRGIYPEAYNNEIIYTKSDVKSLILKEIVLFKQYKKRVDNNNKSLIHHKKCRVSVVRGKI